MTESEFKKILQPLSLLPTEHCKFLENALLGNFRVWKKEEQKK